jgi:hypothetical protein
MCVIDWGLVAEWLAALASVGTMAVAICALNSWHKQMRGQSRHSAAQDAATVAHALRYAFYEARSPFIEAWEFPPAYLQRPTGQRTIDEEADAYAHVYAERRKFLWPYIKAVVDLIPKCGAVLGDEVANRLEKLARTARKLEFYHQYDVAARRDPEGGANWTDKDLPKRAREGAEVYPDRNDAFSLEFEAAYRAVLDSIKRNL